MPAFDLSNLKASREHQRTRDSYRDMLKGLDHPEALKALDKINSMLRMTAAALWDGVQGAEEGRQYQGQIDATVMADLGEAIQEHVRMHR